MRDWAQVAMPRGSLASVVRRGARANDDEGVSDRRQQQGAGDQIVLPLAKVARHGDGGCSDEHSAERAGLAIGQKRKGADGAKEEADGDRAVEKIHGPSGSARSERARRLARMTGLGVRGGYVAGSYASRTPQKRQIL